MKRRDFLKIVGGAALMPAALSFAKQQKRTNVILIMSDDTGYEMFGCYGPPKDDVTPAVPDRPIHWVRERSYLPYLGKLRFPLA